MKQYIVLVFANYCMCSNLNIVARHNIDTRENASAFSVVQHSNNVPLFHLLPLYLLHKRI